MSTPTEIFEALTARDVANVEVNLAIAAREERRDRLRSLRVPHENAVWIEGFRKGYEGRPELEQELVELRAAGQNLLADMKTSALVKELEGRGFQSRLAAAWTNDPSPELSIMPTDECTRIFACDFPQTPLIWVRIDPGVVEDE